MQSERELCSKSDFSRYSFFSVVVVVFFANPLSSPFAPLGYLSYPGVQTF